MLTKLFTRISHILPEPDLRPYIFKIILILISPLCLGLPGCLFPSGFQTRFGYAILSLPCTLLFGSSYVFILSLSLCRWNMSTNYYLFSSLLLFTSVCSMAVTILSSKSHIHFPLPTTFQSTQTNFGAYPDSYRFISKGVRRSGPETSHSAPFSAEIPKAWSYTSTPPYVFMTWYLIKRQSG
jgi:hypothetical protein